MAASAASAQEHNQAIAAPPSTGAWEVEDTTSQVDGIRNVTAILASSNDVPNMGGVADHAFLAIRCQGDTLSAFITWPLFVGLGRSRVTYRFDQAEMQSETWQTSTAGTAVGRFDHRRGEALIRQIAVSRQLATRVNPAYQQQREAVFDLAGAGRVAAQVLAACA